MNKLEKTYCKLFIAMKENKKLIHQIKEEMNDLESNTIVRRNVFVADGMLIVGLKNYDALFTISRVGEVLSEDLLENSSVDAEMSELMPDVPEIFQSAQSIPWQLLTMK